MFRNHWQTGQGARKERSMAFHAAQMAEQHESDGDTADKPQEAQFEPSDLGTGDEEESPLHTD